MGASTGSTETAAITATLKRASAALREADVPFALAGSVAAWARGGPAPCNDLDLAVPQAHAERALASLVATGMRPERPPEGWLLKAWDDGVMVDLIWDFESLEDTETVLARAEMLSVQAIRMPVLSIDDVIVSKLGAFDEHSLDFAPTLAIARALREQIDWAAVRARTGGSPYARGFLALLEALGVLSPAVSAAAREPRIRVVPQG
ncbi:MAG TPA: hypothetical protein VFT42_00655 [Solirubrobacteraceae bacterium]|nr:hypothetical protein [Solirubrobacteraceae bacterium]